MIELLVIVIFLFTGLTIFLYLRSSFRLLEDLQDLAQEVWEQIERPKRVYASGGFQTIKPLLPWMGWILKGAKNGLSENLAEDLIKTRRLFITGLILFVFTILCFLLLMWRLP